MNMVLVLVRCLNHDGGGSTFIIVWKDWKKKRKKPSLHVRGSVGSLTSSGYGQIEVYGGTFLLL